MSVVGTLIVDLVADATKYKNELGKAETETKNWAGRISGTAQAALKVGIVGAATAAAAAVGSVGAAAFQVSTQTQQAAADMAASLALPIDEAERFAEVAKRVYGNNFTDSVIAAGSAVADVAKQFKLAADDPSLQRITEQAIALEDTFDVGVSESVATAKQLMADFGLTSDEAFDFISAGYQRGLDASGDFLDSVSEYSTQFANGGADAGQFFSVLETGMQAGMLGTDKAADSFKEFRLRIIDGSDATAEALDLIGLSAEDMTEAIDSGAMTSADAFALVTQKLSETDDASVRMQAGAGLLGSQFEDMGDSAVAAISMTQTQMVDLAGSTDALNNKYETFGDRATGMWRQVTVAVSPLTDKLLELAEDAMPAVQRGIEAATPLIIDLAGKLGPFLERVVSWIERFGELDERNKRIIAVVGGVLAAIVPLVAVLGPIVAVVSAIVTVAGAVIPVLGAVAGVVMMLINPFTLVLAAVALLVVAWRNDFMGIQTLTRNALDRVRNTFTSMSDNVRSRWQSFTSNLSSTFNSAIQRVRNGAQSGLDGVRSTFSSQMQNVRNVVQYLDWYGLGRNIVQGIASGIRGGAGAIVDAARDAAWRALEAAKRMLGIHSPSTVAAEEIGVPIAEGIGVGMSDAMGNVGGMIGGGLDAMIGSVAPSAAAASGPGVGMIQVTQYFGADADRAAVAAGSQDGLLAGLRQAGIR